MRPRAYVKGVRVFGAEEPDRGWPRIHCATVGSAAWHPLTITLHGKQYNHPNVYGHTVFADSYWAIFPKSNEGKGGRIQLLKVRNCPLIEVLRSNPSTGEN